MTEHTPKPDLPDPGVPEYRGDEPAKRRRVNGRILAVVAVLVAFFVGLGAGGAGTDNATADPAPAATADPVVETETVEVEVPGEIPEEELAALAEREADIEQREAELDEREAAVEQTETEIAEGTIPGDGTWLVGDDIQPGTYRAQGEGDRCYWQRLSGLSGESQDRITNYLGSATTTVEISASDVAFETSRCGEWVRQ